MLGRLYFYAVIEAVVLYVSTMSPLFSILSILISTIFCDFFFLFFFAH